MTIRHDVYVYNESTGLVFTCRIPKSRKSKASKLSNWDQLRETHSILAIELRQDDPCVVRVLVNEILSTQEEAEWVERMTARLHLPTNGLALCGGIDYLEDPSDEENESVQFMDVPSGDYLAELYTYFTSSNFVQQDSNIPDPPDGGEFGYVDFLLRLTPWIGGTSCTPTNDEGWIEWHNPTRKPEQMPRGIPAKKPQGWALEESTETYVPPPGRAKIRLIAVPPGDSPDWVRNAWVGLELPLAPDAPENRDMVYSHEAIAVLALANPEAASWWQANFPKACRALGMTFEFAPGTYERVK